MGNKTDYEIARDEAWAGFHTEVLTRRSEPIGSNETFNRAFLEGYRYGCWVGMEEAKAQPESASNHIPEVAKKVDRTAIAAMAMQGILASEPYLHALDNRAEAERGGEGYLAELAAKEALYYADALIAELKKEKK